MFLPRTPSLLLLAALIVIAPAALTESSFASEPVDTTSSFLQSKQFASASSFLRQKSVSKNEEVAEEDNFPGQWEGGGTYPAAAWVDVAFGNGKYAAIARDGTVGTSLDGKRWTIVKEGGQFSYWTSIAFGDGKFVALTFGTDKALFSSDGVTWSEEKSKPGSWSDITYGNGQFVAVSAQGGIQASLDGQSWYWRMRDTGDQGRPGWRGVDFYKGQFVAAAFSGDKRVATSSNGWDWSMKDFNEVKLLSAAAGEGRLVVGGFSGELFFSEDGGETFTQSETRYSGQISDILYADGYFVAVTNSAVILYSSDGNVWQETNGKAGFLQSLINGSAGVLAVGNWGSGYGLYSISCCPEQTEIPAPSEEVPAGVNWQSGSMTSDKLWRGITYGNDRFVSASMDGAARVSSDGFTWSESEMPRAPGPYSLAFGDGKFVGVVFGSQESVHSSDGVSWEKSSLAPARGDQPDSISAWSDIIYAQNKFVTVSTGGGIQTSANGINWTRRMNSGKVGGTTFRGVAFGNGKFVAVGESGENQAYVSENGRDWSAVNVPQGRWQGVAFGNGKFAAVSLDGKVMKSSDGRNWEIVYTNSSARLYSLDFAGGQFIALGMDAINIGVYGAPIYLTQIVASGDGDNWFERAADLGLYPEITFGKSRFVSVSGGKRKEHVAAVSLPGGFVEETPEDETPEGETPEGETPEGETPEGETPEGETLKEDNSLTEEVLAGEGSDDGVSNEEVPVGEGTVNGVNGVSNEEVPVGEGTVNGANSVLNEEVLAGEVLFEDSPSSKTDLMTADSSKALRDYKYILRKIEKKRERRGESQSKKDCFLEDQIKDYLRQGRIAEQSPLSQK